MSIAMIAAIGKNRELGKNNELIWHFKEDMAFFKQTTAGATVIMGRKTFQSLPKALPGRRNIVITKNLDFHAHGAEIAHSAEEALRMSENEKVFIIGGARIYDIFLPLASTLYLTEIDDSCPQADTYFPAFDEALFTKIVLKTVSVNATKIQFCVYEKKQ